MLSRARELRGGRQRKWPPASLFLGSRPLAFLLVAKGQRVDLELCGAEPNFGSRAHLCADHGMDGAERNTVDRDECGSARSHGGKAIGLQGLGNY